jgi:hypothetical protein
VCLWGVPLCGVVPIAHQQGHTHTYTHKAHIHTPESVSHPHTYMREHHPLPVSPPLCLPDLWVVVCP